MRTGNDNIQQVTLSLPIDKPLSEGFIIAVILHVIIFFGLIVWMMYRPPEQVTQQIPLEVLRFGIGEGKGAGGNLTASGTPFQAPPPDNPLEDASKQQQVKQKTVPAEDYENGMKVVATNVSNAKTAKDTTGGKGKKDVGARDGSLTGTGLTGTGNGVGSGLGFGIDWGGGGNRIVLNKVLPTYPSGVNKDAQIRIRFNVRSDGTVGAMIPVQKGDPHMEDAAFRALRQWKFNPTPEKPDQQKGEITFYFKVD
ncbi:MAG TPA: TonB family protein [Candidatus Kapabacteria bacterium]|nr:TonB family protein [Candidatus Kapabacteria bacterium]